LLNSVGKQLISTTNHFINLSNYSKGIYFVKAFSNGGFVVKKLVVE
jgi:hypothetical protein